MSMTERSGTHVPWGMWAVLAAVAPLLVPAQAFSQARGGSPTFSKDVAPILQQKCQMCHQPNGMAPMTLTTYGEVRPWAAAIKRRTQAREMPPWDIDRTVGIQEFKNDISLSDDQIGTIGRWVDAGAPQGNPADMPPALKWPDWSQWQAERELGRPPDLVFRSTPFTIKATGLDQWYEPVVKLDVKGPRYMMASETRPSLHARRVTHHANSFKR